MKHFLYSSNLTEKKTTVFQSSFLSSFELFSLQPLNNKYRIFQKLLEATVFVSYEKR